ncbi:MAG TPA: aldo/keto reductase [Steroidobacteraceae bacterium]|nr:aldo/keto reductase [Steroidobacteraceae bacterium]
MNDTPPSVQQAAAAAGTITLGGDLRVNRLGYGAMRLTGPGIWGEPKDRDGARRVLRRALELGVNFIDTADAYGPNVNESLIAETLHPYPPGLVIATKGGLVRPGPDQWERDGRPAHLRQACEASLKRLRVERIDLYQYHAPDSRVRIEDSVGELAKLQREGKIRHIGVSNFSVAELERVAGIAKIVSVQNRYNISDRRSDDVIAYCEQRQMAFIPWYPLAAGEHAGSSSGSRELERIAQQHKLTVAQAALAWLLARSPVMLPIPGTSSVTHLEENVAAAGVTLA